MERPIYLFAILACNDSSAGCVVCLCGCVLRFIMAHSKTGLDNHKQLAAHKSCSAVKSEVQTDQSVVADYPNLPHDRHEGKVGMELHHGWSLAQGHPKH